MKRINPLLLAIVISQAIALLAIVISPVLPEKPEGILDPMVLLTGGLVVLTFVLALATIGLWHATFTQAIATRRNAILQSKDMRASLAATKEANTILKQNLIEGKRAWLSIESVKLIEGTRITKEQVWYRARTVVRNLGQTPAKNVEVRYLTNYFNDDLRKPFAEAQKDFKERALKLAKELGRMIYPEKTDTDILLWTEGPAFYGQAIKLADNGREMISFALLVSVSYRVANDDTVRVTYFPYDALNLHVGTNLIAGQSIELQPMAFLSGEAS